MSNITAGDVKGKLESLLSLLSMVNPTVALAASGVEVLKGLFSKNGELSTMLEQVYAETLVTAPDVAQAISAFVTVKGDAMEQSFRDHPGK